MLFRGMLRADLLTLRVERRLIVGAWAAQMWGRFSGRPRFILISMRWLLGQRWVLSGDLQYLSVSEKFYWFG